MNLTRRSLFASAVALLALPRRVAAERLLGPAVGTSPPGTLLRLPASAWSQRIEIPGDLLDAARYMGRAARESSDRLVLAYLPRGNVTWLP